ncbi:hypothetical protein FRC09_013445 [Ceratobasidium sp. 395]|nr:hypothetical protein FRC09_013445 [Ceratobasidium sp. 395]
MVIDPELDVFSAEVVNQVAPAAPALKRSETAPELTLGWGFEPKPPVLAPHHPQTPRKETRARATSTPRRGAGSSERPRTTSTPAQALLGSLQLTPRRGRVQHIPPPTPPVSPSQVSSPRPAVGQDPGSWPSFGAVYDAWGRTGEMHRRQESGESTASSATDVSWESAGSTDTTEYWRGRARSPATSSVRTIVPPPRGSSLVRYDADDCKEQLVVPRRTRRHSSIAALDSILAMEDTFWATEGPVVVREADDGEGEGVPAGQFSTKSGLTVTTVGPFSGDAGGFAFPSEKPKPATYEPVLRIAGVSSPPRSRRGSGVRFDAQQDLNGHRLPPSQFPVTPSSVGEPSPIPAHLHLAGSLFDGPISASPLLMSARGSPALPNASPISAHFAMSIRAPGSPYLSVGRRGSRSTDASSVLMRTASAARLAAALNAAADNDDDDEEFARFGGGGMRSRRSGSLGRSSPRIGLGLALGDEHVRSRANSESWLGIGSSSSPVGGAGAGTMSRSGSRMNLMNPTTSVVEEEPEEEEDYGQVVDSSRFSAIVDAPPCSPSTVDHQTGEASPLIDAFPHPMGGYFPGSRFASRAGTPVRSVHKSNSALSLRQVAAGQVESEELVHEREDEDEEDEDEEVVTTVQRMRHSMQLLAAA